VARRAMPITPFFIDTIRLAWPRGAAPVGARGNVFGRRFRIDQGTWTLQLNGFEAQTTAQALATAPLMADRDGVVMKPKVTRVDVAIDLLVPAVRGFHPGVISRSLRKRGVWSQHYHNDDRVRPFTELGMPYGEGFTVYAHAPGGRYRWRVYNKTADKAGWTAASIRWQRVPGGGASVIRLEGQIQRGYHAGYSLPELWAQSAGEAYRAQWWRVGVPALDNVAPAAERPPVTRPSHSEAVWRHLVRDAASVLGRAMALGIDPTRVFQEAGRDRKALKRAAQKAASRYGLPPGGGLGVTPNPSSERAGGRDNLVRCTAPSGTGHDTGEQ